MWRGRGWTSVAVAVVVLAGGAVCAEESKPQVPTSEVATEAACTNACQGVITRCAGVFGPAMGDMRPFCTNSVVRRCRALGVKVCEPPPAGAP
jgi:hypothetical protein